jgi:hypothetical protein
MTESGCPGGVFVAVAVAVIIIPSDGHPFDISGNPIKHANFLTNGLIVFIRAEKRRRFGVFGCQIRSVIPQMGRHAETTDRAH